MALFERLKAAVERRVEGRTADLLRRTSDALREFPDVSVRQEGDSLILSGIGLARRWLTDVRLRFALRGYR